MESSHSAFMRQLEEQFRQATGLTSRASYKIFYGQVKPAPILTLGVNPGGVPSQISQDGTRQLDGRSASSSAAFFENDENDILDCEWKENHGLRSLLYPLVGADPARFRAEIVKSNLAFRRSARKTDLDINAAYHEAAPFLAQVISRVSPRLVVLTGASLSAFVGRFASKVTTLAPAERDPGVKQLVFAACRAALVGCSKEAMVVQVAHASQFAWTYARYRVPERIIELVGS
jgi:hypothetical protein